MGRIWEELGDRKENGPNTEYWVLMITQEILYPLSHHLSPVVWDFELDPGIE